MSEPSVEEALRVILGPDVLARAFTDDACRRVLFAWRDGRIRPVVTRPLLRYYLRVLRGLGLSERQTRRWMLWFTVESKAMQAAQADEPQPGVSVCMASAAQATRGTVVVTRLERPPGLATATLWQIPEELVEVLARDAP